MEEVKRFNSTLMARALHQTLLSTYTRMQFPRNHQIIVLNGIETSELTNGQRHSSPDLPPGHPSSLPPRQCPAAIVVLRQVRHIRDGGGDGERGPGPAGVRGDDQDVVRVPAQGRARVVRRRRGQRRAAGRRRRGGGRRDVRPQAARLQGIAGRLQVLVGGARQLPRLQRCPGLLID